MTQKTRTLSDPLDPLLGDEVSKPINIKDSPTPSSDSGAINVALVYNYEVDAFYVSDRIGHAGTYVPAFGDTSEGGYEAIENPNTDSAGVPMKGGVGKDFDGDNIHCRLDLIEESGSDPAKVKQPRKAYVKAAQDATSESASSVNPILSVTGDFGQDLLTDSGTLSYQAELSETSVTWKAEDGIDGERLGYILEDSSKSSFILEGFVSESRLRSRR